MITANEVRQALAAMPNSMKERIMRLPQPLPEISREPLLPRETLRERALEDDDPINVPQHTSKKLICTVQNSIDGSGPWACVQLWNEREQMVGSGWIRL